MHLDWAAIGVLTAVMASLVAGSTRYVKMSVREELVAFRRELMVEIKAEFSAKEVTSMRFDGIEHRLSQLEKRDAG